jgi:hypothetical protein
MADRVLEASYRLADPRHLFKAPDDPFSPDYGIAPVLDEVANELYTTTSYRMVRLRLELPEDHTTNESVERIQHAIGRYCYQTGRELDSTRRGERSRGFLALGGALIALAVFVVINRSFSGTDDYWVDLFTEGITVAFWVAVWFPLDTLIFGQWQHRLDQRIYRTLAEMDLDVVATPAGGPTDPGVGSSSAAS